MREIARHRVTLPSQELLEFAEYLGMDIEEDKEFLWIAAAAIRAPLPVNWVEFTNENGEVFYFDQRSVRHAFGCSIHF